MSRRPPPDTFTRFTSASPFASQKPSNPISFRNHTPQEAASVSFGSSGQAGETAAQKVARLRAASRAEKERAQFSVTDRLIDRGRVWADRVHRLTTYGLIGFAGISTVIAVYGLTSLISHNRRQKRAWIEREMNRLRDAQQAFLRGEASAEQLHLLEQERAGEEMVEKARKAKELKKQEGIWSQIKSLAGKGAAAGEMGAEDKTSVAPRDLRSKAKDQLLDENWIDGEVRPVAVAESGMPGVGIDAKGRPVPSSKMTTVSSRHGSERQSMNDAVDLTYTPGSLDRMAGNVANAITPSDHKSDWLSWIRGRS